MYYLAEINLELETNRINEDIAKIRIDIERSNKKLSNPQFMEKAPKEIIEKESEKLAQASKSLEVLNNQMEKIKALKHL